MTHIARGSRIGGEENGTQSKDKGQNKDKKILMTEVMSLVLKPTKDAKMHQAYVDCFITLTKTLCDSAYAQMVKFVCFTYKELLKKFLGGRGTSAHCLNMQFWTQIFEQCSSDLGNSLIKPLLRYLLPNSRSGDIESSKEASRRSSFDDLGIEANADMKK